MSKKSILLLGIISVLLIPLIITGLVLQNPPWVHNPLIQHSQAFISRAVLSSIDVVEVPEDQNLDPLVKLIATKRGALSSGNVRVVTATDIYTGKFQKQLDQKAYLKAFLTIATIAPADIEDKNPHEKRQIIQTVDDLAIRGKIDIIVEASASDLSRADSWGARQAEKLHEAGTIRCVIFDGGHHIETLALKPDILIVPITSYKGQLYASHWFTRDSVSILKLKHILRNERMDSTIVQVPRNGVPIKNQAGMAMITTQAITKIAKPAEVTTRSQPTKNQPHKKQRTPTQTPGLPGNKHKPNKNNPEINSNSNSNSKNNGNSKTLYLSINVGSSTKLDKVAERIKVEIEKRVDRNNRLVHTYSVNDEPAHIYVGLTFGNSRFPYLGKRIVYSNSEIEELLNERLPYKIEVLSEPVSTWDIYRGSILGLSP